MKELSALTAEEGLNPTDARAAPASGRWRSPS